MNSFKGLSQPRDLVGNDAAESQLRVELLSRQQALSGGNSAVLIVVAGVNGSGTGEVIRAFSEWFDPRDVQSFAFSKRSEEERERPLFWRYWMSLPARGNIATYTGAWYSEAIIKRAKNKITERNFTRTIRHIKQFETDLVNDGAIVLKYWLHLTKPQQLARFEKLLADKHNAWRVSKEDKKSVKYYDDFVDCASQLIQHTNTDLAPWVLMNSKEPSSCAWYIANDVVQRIDAALSKQEKRNEAKPDNSLTESSSQGFRNILKDVNLNKSLSKSKYQRRLARYQSRLAELHRRCVTKEVSSVIVFEGWDAAGKGGTIRRITYALDPRHYQVKRISAPSDEELAHHYLWRFWRHIPRAGKTTIYDRSWYGRVLVERVEGYANTARWQQAYDEINDFEQALVEHGTIVCKFWLHLSPQEQLRRFKHREEVPHKRYKITADDYRNRDKWEDYVLAVNEMVARTDTSWAPWRIIPADNKRFARVSVLEYLCDVLEEQV